MQNKMTLSPTAVPPPPQQRTITIPSDEFVLADPLTYTQQVFRRLRGDRFTLGAAGVVFMFILIAAAAPLIAPYDPNAGDIAVRLAPLGAPGHPLGADEQGRDMLTRLIWGGRMSLLAGVIPVSIALLIGGTLGVVAGYLGGWFNTLVMRSMDAFFAFPSILLAIAIAGALGAGLNNALLALSIVFTPSVTRLAESITVQVKSGEFIEAARASGAGALQIIRTQILLNVLSPVLVYASTLVSISILAAAGLSFLGLGVSPPTPEWGLMLNTLRNS
ncbi:MAG: ABC transporter permease, partial [Chloroflexi bacterium]|nr:ABC transporter permease [Chloroflexota bacterium]